MIGKVLGAIRRAILSLERDRIDEILKRFDEKLDHFDERLDRVEISQAEKNQKLAAIYEVTLANHEALEQKLNLSVVSSDMVRQIVDARINSFQESIRRVEDLIKQVIAGNCNS